MRCLSCNVVLTDFEATRKYKSSGDYLDLCENCFKPIADKVLVIERLDLLTTEDVDFEEDEWNED